MKRDKPGVAKPMKSAKPRVGIADIESALETSGVVLQRKEREALFHLVELSEIFDTIQACLEAITRAPASNEPISRLQTVSQLSQWLTDIQVDLYEHMLPMHLRPLQDCLPALIDAVCDREGALEEISEEE